MFWPEYRFGPINLWVAWPSVEMQRVNALLGTYKLSLDGLVTNGYGSYSTNEETKMNDLRTIVQMNNSSVAIAAALANNMPHLYSAPVADHFDNNIPWSYAGGVATMYVHKDTKVADAIKTKRTIISAHGIFVRIVEKRYN